MEFVTSRLLLIGVSVALLVWFFRGGPGCGMTFVNGRLVRVNGAVPARIRVALKDVARDARVSGRVTLQGTNRLSFSRSIRDADRQRFRNALAAVR